MKSLQNNIIWKNVLFVIVVVAVIVSIKFYGLPYISDYVIISDGDYKSGTAILILLSIIYTYFSTYNKIGGPVNTLSNNLRNALSAEWSKIYPINSDIKEFQELEKYSLYLIDMSRSGHSNNSKLLELKETQKQFLNKKFTEDVSKFKLAIDSVLDIVILVDKFGYINYANKALTQLTGLGFEDVENKKVTDLWHKENDPDVWKKNYEEVLKNKKAISFNAFGLKKDNIQFEATIQIAPIKNTDDSVDHFLVVERNVTEEKQKERIKNEFISVVSHELRTPMTVIRGYASLLAEGQLGELNEKQKEYVNKINSQTQQLIELANDMLDIQKFESGKITLKFEKTNMPNFVKEIVEQNQDMYAKKNLKLSFENNLKKSEATIDLKYFSRVISNLLSNAYKYTEKGEVKVFLVNPDEEHIVIAVKDTGVGVKEESLNHLFERFYQADGVMQRKQEGSGLGLSIVKKVVESHSGMVWAESKVGVGSTFYVAIPIDNQ